MSATPLAPYAVASSRCLDLPGFRAHDPYPMRSPLVAADFLVDRLEAAAKVAPDTAITSYVEVGTRDGDNIACVAQLARQRRIRFRATAVEQSPRRCEALRARAAEASPHSKAYPTTSSFQVVETQVNESTYLQALPVADVYYYWGITSTNVQMVRWMDEAARARGRGGTAYLGFDWHYPSDRAAMAPTLLALRDAKGNSSVSVNRLFFDESEGREDVDPAVDDKGERRATYTKPFAKRPGHWGVFHVVRVKVGAGSARLPPGIERKLARKLDW